MSGRPPEERGVLNVEGGMLNEEPDPESIQHSTLNIQHSPSYWRRLYALVLGELALTVAIFYAFTKIFE